MQQGKRCGWRSVIGLALLIALAVRGVGEEATAQGTAVGSASPVVAASPVVPASPVAAKLPAPECVDKAMPNVFYARARVNASSPPPYMTDTTFAYDTTTGRQLPVVLPAFDICDPNTGNLYTLNPDGDTATRFSVREPGGVMVAHFPNSFIANSMILYSLAGGTDYAFNGTPLTTHASPNIQPAHPGALYASEDGGATWAERGAEFMDAFAQIASIADVDARVLYALIEQTGEDKSDTWTVAFSPDAGRSWTTGATGTDAYDPIEQNHGGRGIFTLAGQAAPIATVGMRHAYPAVGPHGLTDVLLSSDGGQTFHRIGASMYGTTSPESATTVVATSAGLLLLNGDGNGFALQRSTDGGATFAPLDFLFPLPTDIHYSNVDLAVNAAMPARVTVTVTSAGKTQQYVSSDGGLTWQASGG